MSWKTTTPTTRCTDIQCKLGNIYTNILYTYRGVKWKMRHQILSHNLCQIPKWPMMDKNTNSLQMVVPTRKRGVDNAKNVECLTVALANFAETRRNLEVLAN